MKWLEFHSTDRIRHHASALYLADDPQRKHVSRRISNFEILFLRHGFLGIAEEGREFIVQPGETIILVPHRHHWGTKPFPPGMRLYYAHFYVEPQDSSPHSREQCLRIPQHARALAPERLALLFQLLTGSPSNQIANLLMQTILIEYAESSLPVDHRPHNRNSSPTELAIRVRNFISEHIDRSLSTHTIARALGYHPNYLSRIFKATFGQTITEAIHETAVQRARRLLLRSDSTIATIAQECGFEDVSYFRRIFRRHTGMTPRNFRLQGQI
ncbi:MAG: AraC family transcriptional regulator [Lentisphaerae bacterium]|nr:MAG: AraC family transcriptional regulator [Lentisphaerota bacterium]